jgi:hypothetical protein
MRSDRLLKLADLLDGNADNPHGAKFYMGAWATTHNEVPDLTCGTTVCAMGLAAISGIFKDDGLGYVIKNGWIDVTFNGEAGGFSAAEKLFEIPADDARHLFDGTEKGAEAEHDKATELRAYVAARTD